MISKTNTILDQYKKMQKEVKKLEEAVSRK
jgi:hypothetical protein